MEERICYQEIKSWVLERLYDNCLDHAHGSKWSYSTIISFINDGYAYRGDTYEGKLQEGLGAFDHAIEYLMLEVICLNLTGSWDDDQTMHYRNEVDKILKHNDLNEMLSTLPDDEREEFEFDFHKIMEITSKSK